MESLRAARFQRAARPMRNHPLPARCIDTAGRSTDQPRDWSDINGSGRGKAGTVG